MVIHPKGQPFPFVQNSRGSGKQGQQICSSEQRSTVPTLLLSRQNSAFTVAQTALVDLSRSHGGVSEGSASLWFLPWIKERETGYSRIARSKLKEQTYPILYIRFRHALLYIALHPVYHLFFSCDRSTAITLCTLRQSHRGLCQQSSAQMKQAKSLFPLLQN